MKEFEDELRLDPTNGNAAYELGEIHRKAGEPDKARELFEMALEHYPDFEEAQIALGRVMIAQGQPERALPHLQKAIALSPANEVAHYQLSVAHGRLGNTSEQQKELAEFQRLQKREREAPAFAPRQVTKQELDANAPPP